MSLVCTKSPVPSQDEIEADVKSNLSDGKMPVLPPMPTCPSPPFGRVRMPEQEVSHWTTAFCAQQQTITLTAILRPLLRVLGLGEDFVPKIPVLDLSVFSLAYADPNELTSKVREKSEELGQCGLVATPMHPGLDCASVREPQALNSIVCWYNTTLPRIITGLIDRVTEKFEISSMRALPEIPSLDSVKERIAAGRAWSDVREKPEKVEIPGFPPLNIKTPDEKVKNSGIALQDVLARIAVHCVSAVLGPIVSFCNGPLSFLGFSFPTVCLPVSSTNKDAP